MQRYFSLVLFIVLVLGSGLAIGFLTQPGDWYAGLAKPDFNPPGWIFGPVWSFLYILIAIAGWRSWQRDRRAWPMRIWWAQLAANLLWSPIFFSAHQVGLALVDILFLLLFILAYIRLTWRPDRVSSLLFLPYAAWVAFASLLNASILVLNAH